MKNTLKGTVELVSGTTLIDGKEKQNTQRTLVLTAYADTDYPKKVAFVAWNKVAEQLDAVLHDRGSRVPSGRTCAR